MKTKGIIPNLSELIRYFNGKAIRLSDGSYLVPCPAHDDKNPSLHLSESPEGKLLFKCFAGCSQDAVQRELERLAWIERETAHPIPPSRRDETRETAKPFRKLGIDEYARAKGLDAQKLREWGVKESANGIAIPYRNADGKPHAVRYRLALEGANRFRWRQGNTPTLYGLWRLGEWELGSDLYLCEGETDTLTLWHADLPALGIPGATAWKSEWWGSLWKFGRIFLIPDADKAGERMVQKLAETCPDHLREKVQVLRLPEGVKDANELWQREGANAERFRNALEQCQRTELPTIATLQDQDPFQATAQVNEYTPPEGTDAYSAEVLGEKLRNRAIWVDELGWLIWTGTHWERDSKDTRILEIASKELPKHYAELAQRYTGEDSEKYYKIAAKSCNANPLKRAIELARPKLRVEYKRLDEKPYLINCQNGIVNLQTGELMLHNPEMYMTKITNTRYEPDAVSELWEQFLKDVFLENDELIRYMQMALGYSITGDTTEQKIFIAYGSGANGKTTLFETISAVIGNYANSVNTRVLLDDGRNDHPTGVADIFGIRLAIASETPEGRRLNENLVKTLTGGDTIKARYLYRDYFSFRPIAKFWLFTNHKPIIRDHSYATWRRIVLIPFQAVFGENGKKPERNMREKLLQEREAILAWLVQGSVLWYKHGLSEPKIIRDAVNEYRRETDNIYDWCEKRTINEPSAITPTQELYNDYEKWCKINDQKPASTEVFGRRLGELGYHPDRANIAGKRVRVWRGIRLKPDHDST